MATTYEVAGPDLHEVLQACMAKYHEQLVQAGVTVDMLLAYNSEGEPAVKVSGYPCAAKVKITTLVDRAKGVKDAEIIIDGSAYHEWSDREFIALLDHELTHLDLCYDKAGNLKRDDIDRPKMKLRLHDRQFGWFDKIANRWGDDSFEVKQAKEIMRDWRFVQMYLPNFSADDLGSDQPLLQQEVAEELATA